MTATDFEAAFLNALMMGFGLDLNHYPPRASGGGFSFFGGRGVAVARSYWVSPVKISMSLRTCAISCCADVDVGSVR